VKKSFKDMDRNKAERYLYDIMQFAVASRTTRNFQDVVERSEYSPAEILEHYPGDHRIAGDFYGRNLSLFREDCAQAIAWIKENS
jgi:hypothetical protein